MHQSEFQKAKLRRVLTVQGKLYTFKRYQLNQFKEKTTQATEVSTLKGLFHNVTSYISVQEGEATRKQRKFTPTIMTLYDDFILSPVLMGDEVEFEGKRYTVTGTENVEEGNYAVDISLEVVDIG